MAHRSFYVAVTGPNLEIRVCDNLGLSSITEMCLADALKPVNIDHFLADTAETKLRALVLGVVSSLD